MKMLGHITGLLVFLVVLATNTAYSADKSDQLARNYQKAVELSRTTGAPFPFHVTSTTNSGMSLVDAYGIINTSFETSRTALAVPANWCDIALLHVNVKACVLKKIEATWHLMLYNVKRHDDPVDEAEMLDFAFTIRAQASSYLALLLSAEHGPYNSRDHHLEVEMAPSGDGKTLLRLTYSYSYSAVGYMAMKGYFAFTKSRPGFSIVDRDSDGNPVYSGGVKGSIERNSVRYYLAVQAYLETLNAPPAQQFERRIAMWHDLSHQYRSQLYSLRRDDYMAMKRKELLYQQKLQAELGK